MICELVKIAHLHTRLEWIEIIFKNVWSVLTVCIPIIVSFATYIATKTQRDVAANQYKLDLFDKKYECISQINKWLTRTSNKEYSFEDIAEIRNYIFLSQIIFHHNFGIVLIKIGELRNYQKKYELEKSKGVLDMDILVNEYNYKCQDLRNYISKAFSEIKNETQIPKKTVLN